MGNPVIWYRYHGTTFLKNHKNENYFFLWFGLPCIILQICLSKDWWDQEQEKHLFMKNFKISKIENNNYKNKKIIIKILKLFVFWHSFNLSRNYQSFQLCYSETLNNEYIERIHQMSYSSLCDNGMLQIFSFLTKWLYGTL